MGISYESILEFSQSKFRRLIEKLSTWSQVEDNDDDDSDYPSSSDDESDSDTSSHSSLSTSSEISENPVEMYLVFVVSCKITVFVAQYPQLHQRRSNNKISKNYFENSSTPRKRDSKYKIVNSTSIYAKNTIWDGFSNLQKFNIFSKKNEVNSRKSSI